MDGKTSLVAKAASKAASKGILVCTAMGNEGSNDWRVLVTPADADSVLSVGAVESLERLSYYSSYGPTADGRRKPNVVACGKDLVAERHGNYDYNEGTSFATPLVAGFAACVKQLHPEWSTMQLLQEIEKSGNHYPYYDYAYGYGIPQATYFTNTNKKVKKPSPCVKTKTKSTLSLRIKAPTTNSSTTSPTATAALKTTTANSSSTPLYTKTKRVHPK